MKMLIYLDSERYNQAPVYMGRIIAEATGGDATVLIVVSKSGHIENGEAVAEQVRQDLEDVSSRVFIREGVSKEIIADEIKDESYQLLVADTERINRIRKSLEVDPVLIKQSDISVLLTQHTKPKIKHILLCSACKDEDYSLIEKTAHLAADLEAEITLLHVISGAVPSMYTGLEQIEETVDELLQTNTPIAKHLRRGVEILSEIQVESDVKIRRGIPIEEIVRETQIVSYDLVVIGSSNVNQGLIERLLGNMAVKIINRLELPVLVVGLRDLE
jgi:nucleotide-binding universal stress UspA family protein